MVNKHGSLKDYTHLNSSLLNVSMIQQSLCMPHFLPASALPLRFAWSTAHGRHNGRPLASNRSKPFGHFIPNFGPTAGAF
jgi:hypothetical protein